MPRPPRSIEAGLIYHVLNRGNGRLRLFRKPEDFASFENVLAQGLEQYPVDLLTYCLLPDHWHLVLRPRTDEALGRFMRWVTVTHVRRHYAHYHLSDGGHLYQGRFKSFAVQDDGHLLTLCRYVEANARKAKAAGRAEQWPWGGAFARRERNKPLTMSQWPMRRPANWNRLLNEDLKAQERQNIKLCIERGRPLGEDQWVEKTANRLGLMSSLRNRGRPRKVSIGK